MIDSVPSIKLAALALDGLAERQKAIAHNLANANTPGFTPVNVSFEAQLQAARDVLRAQPQAEVKSGFSPELIETGAQAVALDEQLALMAQNGLQYQTLTRAIGKQFAILSVAIGDGRR